MLLEQFSKLSRNPETLFAKFAPIVIGRRNYFDNGFSTVIWKLLYSCCSWLWLSDVSDLAFCSYFVGSIPLDPSLAQSLEDGQAFTDLFPNSPTLDAVNKITSKLLEMKNGVTDWLEMKGGEISFAWLFLAQALKAKNLGSPANLKCEILSDPRMT